jgi:TolB-like protein/DNA-binding winged helix-turn-helix (wHTH) protein
MAEISLKATVDGVESPPTRLRFASFTLDVERAELLRDGQPVPLRPKAFALLTLFARNPRRLLTKDELLQAVWPGVVVTDDSLTQCIHDVRSALGDDGVQMIRTVARRGYRFEAGVHPDRAALALVPAVDSKRHIGLVGAAVAVALIVGLVAFVLQRPVQKPEFAPALSIVVLPLVTEGGSDEWLSDGLTRDLTTELGQISGAFVISRDTAHTYKSKPVDPRQVAHELGVRYVVGGAVRRDGERVQLTLSMVDGETGAQRWAQQFDVERTRLASALDEIGKQVARSLSVQMIRAEGERVASLQPQQVPADDLAMQGWSIYFRGASRENLTEANRLFEAAVARDPHCIRAWGGVAVMNGLLAGNLWAPDHAAAVARLDEAARRLHELDAYDAYTFYARYFLALLKSDYESVLAISTTMTERFPSHPQPHFGRALALMNLGRFDECIEPTQRAIKLGPRDPGLPLWKRQIGMCYFMRGEYREAAEYAREAQQLGPHLQTAPLLLAAALSRSGQRDEARAVITELLQRNPDAKASDVEKILRMNRNERYLEGRNRWIDTLRELGMH